jgi:predicted lysophospholipase L1 biosynthesis ABC-type transport system permease subunit
MRVALPLAFGALALATFTLEGFAFASWAVERSPSCAGEPSLACASNVVFGSLAAIAGGVLAGIGMAVATRHYMSGRRQWALVALGLVAGLLLGLHVLQLL